MSDNRQYIERLCEEIQKKGGTPTVGMLRSRSTRQLPIKVVIEALKCWKNNPTTSDKDDKNDTFIETKNNGTLKDRVAILEKQVATLQQQMETLLENNR